MLRACRRCILRLMGRISIGKWKSWVLYFGKATLFLASEVTLVVKNPLAKAGDARDGGSIPGSGRSPGGRQGKPLQYSPLENPLDRGTWWATAHGVAKSQTQLSDWAHTLSLMCRRGWSWGKKKKKTGVRENWEVIAIIQKWDDKELV